MKVHKPLIKVTLIKTRARNFVTGLLPASGARYKTPRILDLTPYLSDGGVVTHKNVREPAGSFTVSLLPRPYSHNGVPLLESLDMLIEPMDIVEIRMAHNPPDQSLPQEERLKWPPIIMRGFVSRVAKSESISNGTPARSIMISGQDFGKILQIIQIYYLNNSVVGDNLVSALKFFQKYAPSGDVKNEKASDFVLKLLKEVINPYLSVISALTEKSGGVPSEMKPDISAEGVVSPFGVGGAQDMTMHQLLTKFLDVGAYNELYIEDRGPDVYLVLRPMPCWGGDGLPYKPEDAIPSIAKIGLGDVVSTQLMRSDEGLYNIFEVTSSRVSVVDNGIYRLIAMSSEAGNPLRLQVQNHEAAFFGIRRVAVDVMLNNPALVTTDADKKEASGTSLKNAEQWIQDRRERLFLLNKDASVFETGSLRLKGNENLRAGMRLEVAHSGGMIVSYYVPAITHEFIPGQGFFTTAQVERGNSFILSAGINQAPDLRRRDLGGVR
jgi:hypothetical protein